MKRAVTLRRAVSADCKQLWALQKTAFAPLLERYRDYDLNPACEPCERVAERLAQPAILAAEQIHGAEHWALSTILQETGNCYLYEKTGYHRTGRTDTVNAHMTLVYYEKD